MFARNGKKCRPECLYQNAFELLKLKLGKIKGGGMINEDNSRRGFLKKAAAAVGVVAAAGVTAKTLISAPSDSVSSESAKYVNDGHLQQKVMSQKQYVLMTDNEKEQMLNEILSNHYKELA